MSREVIATVVNQTRKRNIEKKKHFIEVTAELLEQVPFSEITIRSIAAQAEHNSATIYNHFKDVNELLLLSIYKFSYKYMQKLPEVIRPEMSSKEQYLLFYTVFTEHVYEYPAIYLHYFFGAHGYLIEDIVRLYHELFPEEDIELATDITQELLAKGGMYGFHQSMVSHLVQDGYVAEKNQSMVTKVLTHIQKSNLYDLSLFEHLTAKTVQKQFMQLLNELLSI